MISVIIPTYNSEKYLEDALQSLKSQTEKNIEIIIIDGASTDSTIKIINDYSDIIKTIISEKDEGISDAFNKGIEESSGDVLFFLGSDDWLDTEYVLEKVISVLKRIERPYFLYGNIKYVDEKKKRLVKKNYSYKKFRKYMCIPHQAVFVDRFFFDTYGKFDINYKLAMDYDFFSRFVPKYEPSYINLTISNMRRAGASSNYIEQLREMDRVRLNLGYTNSIKNIFERFLRIVKYSMKLAFKRL